MPSLPSSQRPGHVGDLAIQHVPHHLGVRPGALPSPCLGECPQRTPGNFGDLRSDRIGEDGGQLPDPSRHGLAGQGAPPVAQETGLALGHDRLRVRGGLVELGEDLAQPRGHGALSSSPRSSGTGGPPTDGERRIDSGARGTRPPGGRGWPHDPRARRGRVVPPGPAPTPRAGRGVKPAAARRSRYVSVGGRPIQAP